MIPHCLFGLPCGLLHLHIGLLISGEALVKSLTCNELDLHTTDYTSLAPLLEEIPVSSPVNLESDDLMPLQGPVMSVPVPTCTTWLLTSLVLMVLNVYFPQLSPVSSLWSPLRAAVPGSITEKGKNSSSVEEQTDENPQEKIQQESQPLKC
ncbi:hypothetical protein DSO57_1036377 [Entomophthora muscae]|uniref:Uncharacterized protein n=1 Tax=Entomophthora muscae TaxID=34485 RepID=A0ACC2SNF1_9FUNG|nr:hypothetical protein DSO57_1036377 [Entomophthora muscae]